MSHLINSAFVQFSKDVTDWRYVARNRVASRVYLNYMAYRTYLLYTSDQGVSNRGQIVTKKDNLWAQTQLIKGLLEITIYILEELLSLRHYWIGQRV